MVKLFIDFSLLRIHFRLMRIMDIFRFRGLSNWLFRTRDNLLSASQWKQLKREGLVIVPGFLSAETCSKIKSELDHYFSKNSSHAAAANSDKRVFGFEQHSNESKKFLEHGSLKHISESYLGGPVNHLLVLGAVLNPTTDGFGSGGDWHRDTNNAQIKNMVYLNDVLEIGDGAFQYVKGSHRFWRVVSDCVLKFKSLSHRWDSSQIELIKPSITTVLGKAGDLVIFDTNIIHRGAPLMSGKRYAITNYIYPQSIDTNKMKKHFGAVA